MYCVVDESTFRLLPERPFVIDNGQCYYVTYTGKIGTAFYRDAETATVVLEGMFEIINKLCLALHIAQVNPDTMAKGQRFVELVKIF